MSTQAHTPSRSSFPVVVALIGALLLFWFLTSKVYVSQPPAAATVAPLVRPSLAEHQGKAKETLDNYKVVDAAAGKVRLPIKKAEELVLKENAK